MSAAPAPTNAASVSVLERMPKQGRSQRTLDALAASAEAVLRRCTFDEASLQEIVGGAGVTTGAFYARFRAKDDLLLLLEARIADSIQATTWRFAEFDPDTDDAASLLHDSLRDLAHIYRRNRGAIRALIERTRADPALRARRLEYTRKNCERVEGAVLRATRASGGVSRERVRIGLLFMLGALREKILYREFWPAEMAPADDRLVDELVTAFFAYLRA